MVSLALVHPGRILEEGSRESLEISKNRLAVAIGVPQRRIDEIVSPKRRITADTTMRLSR